MVLYVSDLDGTLLHDNDNLSAESVEIIKECIKKGMNLTVATGRTLFYAKKYLDELDIKLPIILSNGVYIYNPLSGDYLIQNFLENGIVLSILEIFDNANIQPFITAFDDEGKEKIFHKSLHRESMKKVYNWRVQKNDTSQLQLESYGYLAKRQIVSINVIDEESVLRTLYKRISEEFDVTCYFMEDHNYPGNFWFEIYSPNASKGKGIETIKQILNIKKTVCFGDSNNDISMFKVCEESYAVENASQFVKGHAKCIIGTNNENSVAKFLLEKCKEI